MFKCILMCQKKRSREVLKFVAVIFGALVDVAIKTGAVQDTARSSLDEGKS